ncbi:MAG: hypothetical protein CSYNP_00806 [Syntrophus sp. SKADARSKE-3]|nr:hypothetical protein [Syntrophus sp. SKADARSKE-3]
MMLRQLLFTEATKQDGKFKGPFFELYGKEIEQKISTGDDKNAVAELFASIVRERDINGLRWIKTLTSNKPNILDNYAENDLINDFHQRIQDEFEKGVNKTDESHRLIKDIANDLGIMPKGISPAESMLELIKAEYWTEKVRLDVTEEIRALVSDNKIVTIASNDIKEDPDFGTVKKLTIEYKLDGVSETKVFNEGDEVRIP